MVNLKDTKPLIKDQGRSLRELAAGLEKAQIFLTAMELNLFTTLEKSKSAAVLAEEMGYDYEVLQKYLDVLVALGLLVREGKRYRTAPHVAPFLVEGAPYFARYLQYSVKERHNWMKLKQILQEGSLKDEEGEHTHHYDSDTIDWIARGAMLGRVQETLKSISEFPDFQRAQKMIDLGGGHGLFGIGCAQENPQLEVVIFDQQGVTDIAQEYIDQYGLRDRVKVMTGDYTKDDIGNGYDIAFCALSFGGNREESIAFYRRVYEALNDGALFFLQAFTIDDDRKQPLSTLIWDLKDSMWGHKHMHIYTNADVFDIFAEAGFIGEKVINVSESVTMPFRTVVVRKKENNS